MNPLCNLIQKLNHDIEEIRNRALDNICTKLDCKIIHIEDLVAENALDKLLGMYGCGVSTVSRKRLILSLIAKLLKFGNGIKNLKDPRLNLLLKEQEESALSDKFGEIISLIESDCDSVVIFEPIEEDSDIKQIVLPELNDERVFIIDRLPYYQLTLSDERGIISVESFLRDESHSKQCRGCESFVKVLLRDFPPEIFLQRNDIIKSSLRLLTSSEDLKPSAVICLSEFVSGLNRRLSFYTDYSTTDNNVILLNEKEDFGEPCLTSFCLDVVTKVIPFIGSVYGIFRLCLDCARLFAKCLISKRSLWTSIRADKIRKLMGNLFNSFGEILTHFELKKDSFKKLQCLSVVLEFLDRTIGPEGDILRELPPSLKSVLLNSLTDPCLLYLYPNLHQGLREYLELFQDTSVFKQMISSKNSLRCADETHARTIIQDATMDESSRECLVIAYLSRDYSHVDENFICDLQTTSDQLEGMGISACLARRLKRSYLPSLCEKYAFEALNAGTYESSFAAISNLKRHLELTEDCLDVPAREKLAKKLPLKDIFQRFLKTTPIGRRDYNILQITFQTLNGLPCEFFENRILDWFQESLVEDNMMWNFIFAQEESVTNSCAILKRRASFEGLTAYSRIPFNPALRQILLRGCLRYLRLNEEYPDNLGMLNKILDCLRETSTNFNTGEDVEAATFVSLNILRNHYQPLAEASFIYSNVVTDALLILNNALRYCICNKNNLKEVWFCEDNLLLLAALTGQSIDVTKASAWRLVAGLLRMGTPATFGTMRAELWEAALSEIFESPMELIAQQTAVVCANILEKSDSKTFFLENLDTFAGKIIEKTKWAFLNVTFEPRLKGNVDCILKATPRFAANLAELSAQVLKFRPEIANKSFISSLLECLKCGEKCPKNCQEGADMFVKIFQLLESNSKMISSNRISDYWPSVFYFFQFDETNSDFRYHLHRLVNILLADCESTPLVPKFVMESLRACLLNSQSEPLIISALNVVTALAIFVTQETARSLLLLWKGNRDETIRESLIKAMLQCFPINRDIPRLAIEEGMAADIVANSKLILQQYSKSQGKKRKDILGNFSIYLNLAWNMTSFRDAIVNEALIKCGFPSILHSWWSVILKEKSILELVLKVAVNLTANTPNACRAMALSSPTSNGYKKPSGNSLICAILDYVKEGKALECVKLGLIVAKHACQHRDSLNALCGNRVEEDMLRVLESDCCNDLKKAWLDLALVFTTLDRGLVCFFRKKELPAVVVEMARCEDEETRFLALSILKNVAFNSKYKIALQSNGMFATLMESKFEIGMCWKERDLALVIMKAAFSNGQRGKHALKRTGILEKLALLRRHYEERGENADFLRI